MAHIPRRTALTGAAWTVPVVAVAAAIPQASASTTGDIVSVTLPDRDLLNKFGIGFVPGLPAGTPISVIPTDPAISIASITPLGTDQFKVVLNGEYSGMPNYLITVSAPGYSPLTLSRP